MILSEVIKSTRPQQWLKNFFVFAPLLFSQNVLNLPLVLKSVLAFIVFCLISGAVYIFNDLRDLEEDKQHPLKSQRPLAAGRIKTSHAVVGFLALSIVSFALAATLSRNFLLTVFIYFVLQLAYSLRLKHVVILDVFIIAAGFLLRVVAGGFAIEVYLSPWLLICTLLLALFLAMSKRRHELILLQENASAHRPILKEYSPHLLDQMISVVTASTVMAYCLYTISEETVAKFGTTYLILTVPFVIYGIFRYLYLVHQKSQGGSPEMLILKDKPLLFDFFLWILTAGLILYL
ncbi:MAG: decaprenyl-phosphate phosphoribosyltransferase [Candidatus Aminicenantes bacterium]|nr:decaprenyl-phosphate phosphoribosyltransferase [Candidatus Aminicenantes bacterium]